MSLVSNIVYFQARGDIACPFLDLKDGSHLIKMKIHLHFYYEHHCFELRFISVVQAITRLQCFVWKIKVVGWG